MNVLQWTKQSMEEEKEIGTQQVEIWAESFNGYGMAEGAETRVQQDFCSDITEQKVAPKIKRKRSSKQGLFDRIDQNLLTRVYLLY